MFTLTNLQPDPWPPLRPELGLSQIDTGNDRLMLSVNQLSVYVETMGVERDDSPLIGIEINGEFPITKLPSSLEVVNLVKIKFASFNDGRGFSLAQNLRNQLGYTGEIWATNIIQDNLLLLMRCGFNGFILHPEQDEEKAWDAFSQQIEYFDILEATGVIPETH